MTKWDSTVILGLEGEVKYTSYIITDITCNKSVEGLGPNPQPRRIPFRSTTVPDDMWNRLWAQCVKRHTG